MASAFSSLGAVHLTMVLNMAGEGGRDEVVGGWWVVGGSKTKR